MSPFDIAYISHNFNLIPNMLLLPGHVPGPQQRTAKGRQQRNDGPDSQPIPFDLWPHLKSKKRQWSAQSHGSSRQFCWDNLEDIVRTAESEPACYCRLVNSAYMLGF